MNCKVFSDRMLSLHALSLRNSLEANEKEESVTTHGYFIAVVIYTVFINFLLHMVYFQAFCRVCCIFMANNLTAPLHSCHFRFHCCNLTKTLKSPNLTLRKNPVLCYLLFQKVKFRFIRGNLYLILFNSCSVLSRNYNVLSAGECTVKLLSRL
jgi:hypothetical protein